MEREIEGEKRSDRKKKKKKKKMMMMEEVVEGEREADSGRESVMKTWPE